MAQDHSIPSPIEEGLRNSPKSTRSIGSHGQKRPRSCSQDCHSLDAHSQKRRRLPSPPPSRTVQEQQGIEGVDHHELASDKDNACEQNPESGSAIDYWARHSTWPANFAEMNPSDSSQSSRKRKKSYSQGVKDGELPKAHSAAAESELARNGVYMDEPGGRSFVSEESRTMCEKFLAQKYADPSHTLFPLSRLSRVCARARPHNEARVVRDLGPLLTPSAELLFLSGGHDDLEHIIEEIGTEWNKPNTMGGPKPKPDLTVGISPSAFTSDEVLKMRHYTSPTHPTLFTSMLYFPFLIAEAKCGRQGMNEGERQNVHSASIAVNGVIQLYESSGLGKATDLMGQFLVFTITYDNERAKIYGHYANGEGGRLAFYRYLVGHVTFDSLSGTGWQAVYSFAREMYKSFYPAHRKRIQDALNLMASPTSPDPGVELDLELEPLTTEAESQSEFRVPGRSATQLVNDQNKFLQEQNKGLQEQNKGLQEQMKALQEQMGILIQRISQPNP